MIHRYILNYFTTARLENPRLSIILIIGNYNSFLTDYLFSFDNQNIGSQNHIPTCSEYLQIPTK